jgi:hypothetical protein
MGRARLLSKKVSTIVLASEKFVIYKIPSSGVGMFHSAETDGKFVVVKFFPKLGDDNFTVINGDFSVEFT